MGLFDWFEPDPPIPCLKCKTGTLRGWQEKHERHALFLWRQGVASPVDQILDDEVKIDALERAVLRLPRDQVLSIYYGDCDECGATFPFHLDLEFSGETWTGFAESDRVRYAEEIEPGWLQCPKCLDAHQHGDRYKMATCSNCDLLLLGRDTT